MPILSKCVPPSASEQWRRCVDATDYEVSDLGRVRRVMKGSSTAPGRLITLQRHRNGYTAVSLRVDCRERKFLVHRLVAIAFIGRPPADRPFVDHLDGVKVNNSPSNLEWVSHAENSRRAARLGLMKSGAEHGLRVHPDRAPQGERNGGAKLSTDQVQEARRRSEAGDSYRTIAEDLRVSITTIGRIVRGELWRSLPKEAGR